MIVVIDNYDSFTYNLVQAIGALDGEIPIKVVLNDETTVEEIARWNPTHLIFSPGPGGPSEAGICISVIRHFAGRIPILGVCLGHQCIGHAFGARVVRADRIMHGKTSAIHHDGQGVFCGVPNPFTAARYHSLVINRAELPEGFVRTAWTDLDEVMGIRNERLVIEGVQFHPESFLTDGGERLIHNFLRMKAPVPCFAHPDL